MQTHSAVRASCIHSKFSPWALNKMEVAQRYAIGELVYISAHLNAWRAPGGKGVGTYDLVECMGIVTNTYKRFNYVDVMTQYGELVVSMLFVSTVT